MKIFGRFSDFEKIVQKDWPAERIEAVKIYLSDGGILKIEGATLIYPGKDRIISQIEKNKEKRKRLEKKIRFLKKRYWNLISKPFLNKVFKFLDPLYFEHLIRKSMDPDYRESAEAVHLPFNQIQDKKKRKIIELFLRRKEYRENLAAAGPILTMNQEKGADKETIQSCLKNLKKKKQQLAEKQKALQVLLDWSCKEPTPGWLEKAFLSEYMKKPLKRLAERK